MKKQMSFVVVFVVFLLVFTCGCTEKPDAEKLIGRWYSVGDPQNNTVPMGYIFYQQNFCSVLVFLGNITNGMNGTWELNGNQLMITLEDGTRLSGTYHFSSDGNTVTIINDEGVSVNLIRSEE